MAKVSCKYCKQTDDIEAIDVVWSLESEGRFRIRITALDIFCEDCKKWTQYNRITSQPTDANISTGVAKKIAKKSTTHKRTTKKN